MSEERIINRIRKMLAIANDLAATEAERDTALNMAYNVMAKYNLDMGDVAETLEERVDFKAASFSFTWARSVNNIVAQLFFCSYYYGEKINGTQCQHHFVGKESNAMTAAVMADWIVKSILKEGRALYKQNTSPECRSFAVGAKDKLRSRAREIKAKATTMTTAGTGRELILLDVYKAEEAANEAFLQSTGTQLVTKKSRSTSLNEAAYQNGQEFGAKINLSLQVDKNAAQTTKRIG